MLLGVSAFAETRHRNETRMRDRDGAATSDRSSASRGSSDRSTRSREPRIERERQPRGDSHRGDRETYVRPDRDTREQQRNDRNNRTETWSRSRGSRDEARATTRGDRREAWNRDDNRGRRGDRSGTWNRDNNRGTTRGDHTTGNRDRSNHGSRGSWQRPPSRDRYGRQAYNHRGHVSRCERYGGGYRVWISGSRYPFYVPLAYYSSHRFRVGIALDLWGYYNPVGYYDYYDTGYRGVRSEFRGVVEEVDYRRDRLVVRNDETGNFVTVNLGSRRFDDVRPGDSVWIEGDWTRSSVFVAHDLRLIDDDRYETYER
jgi:hypothetical protein